MKNLNVLSKIFIVFVLILFCGIGNISNATNITSNEYKLITKENKDYIIGIYPNTTSQQLRRNIKTNGKVEIYNKKEKQITDDEIVETGSKIKIGNKAYVAIVSGDIDGNGKIGLTDLVMLKEYLVGKQEFLMDKKIAADIDVNGEVTVADILFLKRLLVSIIDENELYEIQYVNDEFEYKKNKLTDKITIVQLNNNQLGSTLRIPNKIDGKEVKKIEGFLGENSKITEVIIPTNIDQISNVAFSGMEKLTKIQVSELNEQYNSDDGILYNKEKTKLITYPRGKKVEEFYIDENVKEIGEYAFYRNDKTEIIYIPETVEKVAQNSFEQSEGRIFIKDNSKVKGILENEKIAYEVDSVPEIKKLEYTIQKNKEVRLNIEVTDKEGIVAWTFARNDVLNEEWISIKSTKKLSVNQDLTCKNGTYVLKIKDKAGNIVSKELKISDLDESAPKVTAIKITNPVNGEYIPGEKITIRVCFSEKIKGTAPTLKLKIGNAIGAGKISAKNPDGTKNYIDYTYISNDSQLGKIEIYSYSGGNITDTYGNKAEIKTLKNTGEIITLGDTIKPEVTSIKVISPTSGTYSAGQKVTIRVQFSEKIKGTPPLLYLEIGKAMVRVYPTLNSLNGNETYIDYEYTTNSMHTGELKVYSYSGGNITDSYGNKAEIKTLNITGSKITVKDITKPEVTSIKVIGPVSGIYNPGQKITVRVQFSEIIKGISPTLRLKIGNAIVTANSSMNYLSGTNSYIDYTYITNYTNAGEVEVYSYTGGNIIDAYGNRAMITTIANTGESVTIRDAINPTIKSIEILKPVNGTYKTGQEIVIRVNFSENVKGIAPKLELKIGNAIGTGKMEVTNPIVAQSYIDYTYTVNNEHSGIMDIYNYSGGTLTDMYGNKAIITTLPNTGNEITIRKINNINLIDRLKY